MFVLGTGAHVLQIFVFIYIYKIPSEFSLLQAEQSQLSYPFLTGEKLKNFSVSDLSS